MSKLVLTSKELKDWKIKGSKPILLLYLRRNYDKKQILRFGFESEVNGAIISITHLTPLIGFFKKRTLKEFRSSLREGLFITYHKKRNDVEIIMEKLDGKERLISLKRK